MLKILCSFNFCFISEICFSEFTFRDAEDGHLSGKMSSKQFLSVFQDEIEQIRVIFYEKQIFLEPGGIRQRGKIEHQSNIKTGSAREIQADRSSGVAVGLQWDHHVSTLRHWEDNRPDL